MIIHSLELENIRSYRHESIEFPASSVLLSGDIGSGKTTVLLAIEFALFGIMKGEITGGMLLRHGEKQGSVKLKFSVENKEVEIQRILKKGSAGISQAAGFISVNGVREELTPVELKSRILELLGYPEELLTKSKGLIFRFTVYTPQEMMKSILFEDPEARLDTLRTIFNIDKYRNIKENVQFLAKNLRRKEYVLKARIERLDNVRDAFGNFKKRSDDLSRDLHDLQRNVSEQKAKVSSQKDTVISFEKKIMHVAELRKESGIAAARIKSTDFNITSYSRELESLKAKLEREKKDLPDSAPDLEELCSRMGELQKKLSSVSESIKESRHNRAKLESRKEENAEKIIKLKGIDKKCPTCLQKVESEHVCRIEQKNSELQKAIDENIQKIEAVLSQQEKDELMLRCQIDELREREKEAGIILVRLKSFDEGAKRSEQLSRQLGLFFAEKKELSEKLSQLSSEMLKFSDVEERFSIEKKALDGLNERLKQLEISFAEKNKELESVKARMLELDGEIKHMEMQKAMLRKVQQAEHWLTAFFLKVTDYIEKQVMAKILQEFSELFSEWFAMLMEDGSVTARLDENFTPLIEQDGYETAVENLSGGEKTSLALAYRLALNRVINDLISTIKTKDLLILDEPTDGFSSEQLDKVRDVLERINIRQLIIVSHEQKLESYASHIIRIRKSEHSSVMEG
ncbi:MAG: SMC family ATPase [Candidatus Woesearchaeota archaeon]